MHERKELPQEDPAEGSRAIIDRELARQDALKKKPQPKEQESDTRSPTSQR